MPVASQDVTLDEFIKHMRTHLQNFPQWWQQGQAEAPENWPDRMSKSDWLDHFLTFLELGPSK